MIQQINLYQDILKQGQGKLGINLYVAGLSATALLFIGFSGYVMWNYKNAETQAHQLREALVTEQARVSLISAQTPKQEINPQLAAEVAQWQNLLDELTQTVKLLSGKSADQSPGFSSYFQALSNQSDPDVWLSALYIDGQQQLIKIEGSTFKPEKIPYFLQQLQKEPIFNGHTFAKLTMQKSEKMISQIDFWLSTTLDSPDKKNDAH